MEQGAFKEYIRNWMKKNIEEFVGGQKTISTKSLKSLAERFVEDHFVTVLTIAAEVAVEYEETKK